MASIRREARIAARPKTAWAALRDVGAIHTRLAPGFVTDTKLEKGARMAAIQKTLERAKRDRRQ
jgi:hypothetical protein